MCMWDVGGQLSNPPHGGNLYHQLVHPTWEGTSQPSTPYGEHPTPLFSPLTHFSFSPHSMWASSTYNSLTENSQLSALPWAPSFNTCLPLPLPLSTAINLSSTKLPQAPKISTQDSRPMTHVDTLPVFTPHLGTPLLWATRMELRVARPDPEFHSPDSRWGGVPKAPR